MYAKCLIQICSKMVGYGCLSQFELLLQIIIDWVA